MKPRLTLVVLLAASAPASGALAQGASVRPEIAAQLSYWRLDAGFHRVGPTATIGVFLPRGTPIAFRLTTSYAPKGDVTPGIFALGAQVALRLLQSNTEGSPIGLTGVLGFGGLRYNGTTGRDLGGACGPPDCFEGVFFRGGWSRMLDIGLALELPLSPAWFVRPSLNVNAPLGDTSDGPGHAVLQWGIGVGRR